MTTRFAPPRGGGAIGLVAVAGAAVLAVSAVASLLLPAALVVPLLLAAVVALVAATRVDLAVAIYVFVVFTEAAHVAVERAGFSLLAELVVGLVLVAHLGDGRAAGIRSGASRVLLLVLPFALWSLASFFWASVPGPVLGRFSDHVRYLGITIVLVAAIRTERTFRFAVWGIVAGGAFLGLVAVAQTITGHVGSEFFFGFGGAAEQGLSTGVVGDRVVGPLGDANFFAQRMVVVLPFAIERAVNERRGLLRLFAAGTVLVTLATILLTYSRGGALAAAFVLLVCLFHFLSIRRALVLIAIAVGVATLVVPSTYIARVLAVGGVTSVATTSETSVRGRTSAILVGLQMFEDHPVAGVGTLQYPVLYADYAKAVGLDPGIGRAPHNLYLELAAENGLVGLGLFSLIVGGALWSAGSAMRRLRAVDRPAAAEMVWATRAALGGYLVASLFLHFAYPRVFFALIALCIAAPFLVEAGLTPRPDTAGTDRRPVPVDA